MGGHSNNPFARQSSQQQQTGADDDDDASTTRMYARLCETQEASLRQALEEKEAAVTRLRENESTVKELVDAMDEAVKAQEALKTQLATLQQQQQGPVLDHPALEAAQARVQALQAEKEALAHELEETKQDVTLLTRWNRRNRPDMKERREAEQETVSLRTEVGKILRRYEDRLLRHREYLSELSSIQGGHEEAALAAAAPNTTTTTTTNITTAPPTTNATRTLENKVAELEDELQCARAVHESMETAVLAKQGQLEECQAELSRALGRLTGLEAQVQERAGTQATLSALQEEVEGVEAINHDLGRQVMGLEAMLSEAVKDAEGYKAHAAALEKKLLRLQVGLDEATAKAQASVDEIIQLKMGEAELQGQVEQLEEQHTQDETRLSLLRDERDTWRRRAEEEVTEWVGVSMSDHVGEKEEKEEEEEAQGGTGSVVPPPTPNATALVSTSEELGGLDPLQALMDENIALRMQIEALRRREAETQLV